MKGDGLNRCIAILFFVTSLLFSFVLVLQSEWIYRLDIDYLHIDRELHMSSDKLLYNYRVIMNYLTDPTITVLRIPDFAMSEPGRIHFSEVKNLIALVDVFLYVGVILCVITVSYQCIGRREMVFLRWTARGLLLVPVAVTIALVLSFERVFTLFHQLLFRNQYWVFDPICDPIIYALPQEFFFHCGIVWMFFLLLISGIYFGIDVIRNKK